MSRRPPLGCAWLQALAESYLGPFPITRRASGTLSGYIFERAVDRIRLGFFVGFLSSSSRVYRYLNPQPPECLVFAFVRLESSGAHRRLVRRPASLFRQTYEFLEKYTATLPRFEFHEQAAAALARHVPLAGFPRRLRTRYARNFFIETLALLVRTRLPDYLRTVRIT